MQSVHFVIRISKTSVRHHCVTLQFIKKCKDLAIADNVEIDQRRWSRFNARFCVMYVPTLHAYNFQIVPNDAVELFSDQISVEWNKFVLSVTFYFDLNENQIKTKLYSTHTRLHNFFSIFTEFIDFTFLFHSIISLAIATFFFFFFSFYSINCRHFHTLHI